MDIIRVGNDIPELELTHRNDDTEDIIPVTGAVITAHARFEEETSDHFSRAATVIDGPNGRFDFAFLKTDFSDPETLGILRLWFRIVIGAKTVDTDKLFFNIVTADN